MKEKSDMYMEDVADIASSGHDVIAELLEEYGIALTVEKSDELYEKLFDFVETYCPNNYKNYN